MSIAHLRLVIAGSVNSDEESSCGSTFSLTATFAGFALLAAALGAIGLFGVVAHDVASRRFEPALRIALGADPIRILTATLSRGAAMIGWGVIVGAVLSMWTARAFVATGFAANQIDPLSIGLPAL